MREKKYVKEKCVLLHSVLVFPNLRNAQICKEMLFHTVNLLLSTAVTVQQRHF